MRAAGWGPSVPTSAKTSGRQDGETDELPAKIGPYSLWPNGNSIRVYCPFDLRQPVLKVRGATWSAELRAWMVPATEIAALLTEVRWATRVLAAAIAGRPLPDHPPTPPAPPPEPRQARLDFGAPLPVQHRPKRGRAGRSGRPG